MSDMETEGVFAPETREKARSQFVDLEPAADEVVRAVAKQMEFDTAEFRERVTDDVTETAREALYASLLEVYVADRAEYESWCDTQGYETVEIGPPNVDRVVWHAPAFAETAVAATFQNERDAAVNTLRRQAFGRLYLNVLRDEHDNESDSV